MDKAVFWWHFHQPLYKDYKTGEYKLPWVFLHLLKDYHFFLKLAKKFPNISQNFNYSPVLLEQIEDYVREKEKIRDRWVQLFLKSPIDLNDGDKEFVVNHFFSTNFEKNILKNSLYHYLFKKKNENKDFTDEDFLDLQFLFFYNWLSPMEKEDDNELRQLINREHYTENDKRILWNKIVRILDQFFPLLKEVSDHENIEITISPYYHPILPLLIDTNCVKNTNIKLPAFRFNYPKDAEIQINQGISFIKKYGINPDGMWPSEGSLDENSIELIKNCGIKYVGSDSRVLKIPIKLLLSINTSILIMPYPILSTPSRVKKQQLS